MEFAEVVRRRRMIRRFAQRPPPSGVVDKILANAVRAPNAGFSQGWAFLVLTEEADLDRFWPFVPNQTNYTPELMNAPLVIVPLAYRQAYVERYEDLPEDRQWPAPYWYIDTGMASMLMLLTVVDEGLDALLFWIMPPAAGGLDGDKVPGHLAAFRAEFGIPAAYAPIGAIAVGYRPDDLAPQSPETAKRRRDLAEFVHHGQWSHAPRSGLDQA